MNESVVIVGAGSGLSASLAKLCASKGMRVVLAARNIEKLQNLKKEIGADTIKCDATSIKSVASLFKKTDKIIGAHMIGHEAGTVIHELSIAMGFGASSEDVARICHGHPTVNEAVKEAALATYSKAIHF